MKQDNIAVPQRLRRLCWLVRAGAAFGALAWLGLQAWIWSSPEVVGGIGPLMAGMPCDSANTDATTRMAGAAASVLPGALWLLLAQRLWVLFGLYGRGQALTTGAQRLLQQAALLLLAQGVVGPLYRGVLSVVLTYRNAAGERHLVLGFGSDDYLWLLLAAVLLAVATVMRQAVAAAEENRGFV